MVQWIIETKKLGFSFGRAEAPALSDVNLQVPAGSIYCFLGPNGAGKTTTLRILLGLITGARGDMTILGKSLTKDRIHILRKIGSLIEQPSLYGHLTGAQNLGISRLTYQCNASRIDEVLSITNMLHARNQAVSTYSLGMKQRLAIAQSMLHDPEILILDEPTNGLDPQGIVDMRELILKLQRVGNKTVIVSSHLLSEAEKIATHFGVIAKGKMLFQGSKADLNKLRSKSSTVDLEVDNIPAAVALLQQHYAITQFGDATLRLADVEKSEIPDVTRKLVAADIGILRIGQTETDLEQTFFNLVS